MKLLKKRPAAILIMIAAMLLSVFIGGRRSLDAERERIQEYFYTIPDGYSIQSELDYISATVNNFKTVATRYIEADDAYIVQLNEARAKLSAAETVSDKHEAAGELHAIVTALYGHLDPARFPKMNSTDKSFRQSLYDDIVSAMQRIEENAYNRMADEFNEMLEDVITGTIARFTGITPLPIYE